MQITLKRLNPPTTLDVVGQTISFPEAELTVKEFTKFSDRVHILLRRYNLLPPLVPQNPKSMGGHPFLVNNTKEISHRQRGYIKKAPLWLRWFCDAVVTKDRYTID